MFGKNPIRAPEKHDGSELYVQSIFKTIQGEGPHVGMPAMFIRLGGCNLACEFCDTEFESFKLQKIQDIMTKIADLCQESIVPLAVITGGEPLRQNISLLCDQLIEDGYKVQIETNGTLWRPLAEEVEIICSPKQQGRKYFSLRPDVLKRINALKFIVSTKIKGYDIVPDVGQVGKSIPVFVQPMDECDEQQNVENARLAVKLALEGGYRVSLQIHKILDIE